VGGIGCSTEKAQRRLPKWFKRQSVGETDTLGVGLGIHIPEVNSFGLAGTGLWVTGKERACAKSHKINQ